MEIYIEKYGATLTKAGGSFSIHTEDGAQQISPDKTTALYLGPRCRVSTEALLMALEHNVEVFFMDRRGYPQARLWGNRFGSISTIRRKQLNYTRAIQGWKWMQETIAARIEGQMGVLMSFQENDIQLNVQIDIAVGRLNLIKMKVEESEFTEIEQVGPSLRGREGSAAKIYFDMLKEILPDAWKFKERSRRPAADPFNALLNYAYGILYTQVESACIIAGLDPCLGILHRDEYNRPTLVYDMIENYRIWAEFVVIFLCKQQVWYAECFQQIHQECHLEPDARKILIQAFKDYLDEIITIKGLARSRKVHIQQDAYRLADEILKIKDV
jgi:CRISP-associated protein Cas1